VEEENYSIVMTDANLDTILDCPDEEEYESKTKLKPIIFENNNQHITSGNNIIKCNKRYNR
jgi:hypothetical protein